MKHYIKAGWSLFILLLCISAYTSAQTVKKPSLNHLAIYVVDLEKSTTFYRDIIGLETMDEPFKDGHHSWFKVGPHSQVHIISGAQAPTTHNKNTHICFSVPVMNDFLANLRRQHISYEDWAGKPDAVTNRVDGVKQVWLQDPDGYWIEINDDKY
ncbi:VOC family protein [Chitinophaga sp. sic0106]|uniref:VOC family protein n=1 Tax=Chitinophaga sp. sic0106 TaxID=2854785 RepID=UPI001C4899FA|nr:VOC family protein [Chitinophaga sp. sic0106]MBV7532974.1 VOC family protein [Chitinophaga sp. sic0106]